MKKLALLGFFIFLGFNALMAQDTGHDITLHGQILNQNQEPIPFVHIVNLKNGRGAVSDLNGKFEIKINTLDTVMFSAIGYEKSAFTVKRNMAADEVFVKITMNTRTYQLEPVEVTAYLNEDEFKKALVNLDVPLTDEKSLKVPGVYYGKPRVVKPGKVYLDGDKVTLNGPLTFLADKISGRDKMRKKLVKARKEYDFVKKVRAKYNLEKVIELTGLTEEKAVEFMKYCTLDDHFVAYCTEYELALAVNKCLDEYKEEQKQE